MRDGILSLESTVTLEELGSNIRRARLRRNLTQADLAGRAGVGLRTLARLESGEAGVSLGALVATLTPLGLLSDVGLVASPERDERGIELERLNERQRARGKEVKLDTDF